jgi:1-acyl-sn-glycerol-3-phosphate acyltransferase
MLRTIIWFIWFWVSLILSLPALLWANILDRQGKNDKRIKVVHKVTSLWTKLLINLSGSKVTVTGKENLPEGSVLYVSNHQSNFDIPLLMTFIDKPKGFIAKIELTKMPFVASWMRQMKCIFMDRNDIRKSMVAINQGADYLREGYSMVIFPEGTRSGKKEMGEFKAGSFKLAVKSGVSIVPVAIDGSYNIMGKKSLIIKPAKVNINILEPIHTDGLSKEEIKLLPGKVEKIIKDCLE